jgi:flagella basal body P-ring formation protein FlgA
MMAILLAAAACVAVDGEKILARDLAPAAEAFQSFAPDTEFGYAPAPGARRILHAAELSRMIARHGSIPGTVREICVERATETLTRESLEAALHGALGQSPASVELLDWSRYRVPHGEMQFPPGGRSRLGGHEVLWRGYVGYGSSRRFAIWARVRVTVRQQRVVARTALPAGKPIRTEQLGVEEVEASPFDARPEESVSAVAGWLPRRAVAAGTPIVPGLLEAPQEIHSGDTVTVEVSNGLTRLSFDARAGAGGRRGDLIPVRNPSTGKSFHARVESPTKVSIAIAGQGEK